MMSPEISMKEVMEIGRRPGMWLQGGDVYLCIAAYLLGISRVQPSLFEGFVEYVAVSRSGNAAQDGLRAF